MVDTVLDRSSDILVNNAGVMPDSREYSPETAWSSPSPPTSWPRGRSLTNRPNPCAAPFRVINVVSGGQYGQALPAGDPRSERNSCRPKKIYARTERAEPVITEQWADLLRNQGIRVPDQGADAIVWPGSSDEQLDSSGSFWHDRRPRPTTYAAGPGRDDDITHAQLWQHVSSLAAR
ncbi:hypothetical protein ABZ871_11200 [Streptomyces populi]